MQSESVLARLHRPFSSTKLLPCYVCRQTSFRPQHHVHIKEHQLLLTYLGCHQVCRACSTKLPKIPHQVSSTTTLQDIPRHHHLRLEPSSLHIIFDHCINPLKPHDFPSRPLGNLARRQRHQFLVLQHHRDHLGRRRHRLRLLPERQI